MIICMTHFWVNPKCLLVLQWSSQYFHHMQKISSLSDYILENVAKNFKTLSRKLASIFINLNTSSKPTSSNHWVHHCTHQWWLHKEQQAAQKSLKQFFPVTQQIQLLLDTVDSFRYWVNQWYPRKNEKQTLANPAAMMERALKFWCWHIILCFENFRDAFLKITPQLEYHDRAELQSAYNEYPIVKI